MYSKGFQIAVEMPLKVKRTFKVKGHKSDPVDARQIAEYAYRFKDELELWQPNSDMVEQLRVLLSTREQLVQQKTATGNSLKTI